MLPALKRHNRTAALILLMLAWGLWTDASLIADVEHAVRQGPPVDDPAPRGTLRVDLSQMMPED